MMQLLLLKFQDFTLICLQPHRALWQKIDGSPYSPSWFELTQDSQLTGNQSVFLRSRLNFRMAISQNAPTIDNFKHFLAIDQTSLIIRDLLHKVCYENMHFIMADTKKIVDTYKTLCQEWNKKPPNLEKCGSILDSLKVFYSYIPG